jgi:hypothetical protein
MEMWASLTGARKARTMNASRTAIDESLSSIANSCFSSPVH